MTLFDRVIALGEIIPAVNRIARAEFEAECLSDKKRGSTIYQEFPEATPHAVTALEEMVYERLELLPEQGTTQSAFNCIDFLAGDFQGIFLWIARWRSGFNGFVFDAEQLLQNGARFRQDDLLGSYARSIQEAAQLSYPSPLEARAVIESMLEAAHEEGEASGEEGIRRMRAWLKVPVSHRSGRQPELFWPGALPLDLAIEAWREGTRIW